MTELRGVNELPGIEEILRDDVPASGGIPTLSGGVVEPLELCRLIGERKDGSLLMLRTRFIGNDGNNSVFVNRDNGTPLVLPKKSLGGPIGVLPEPQLPLDGEGDGVSIEVLERQLRYRPAHLPEEITTLDNHTYWGA